MAQTKDVMVYLLKNYPHSDELVKTRLTKLVYLADWKSSLDNGRQITDIVWTFDHYGPFVKTVMDIAVTDPSFRVIPGVNRHGHNRQQIVLADESYQEQLTAEEKRALDFVINATKTMTWNAFIQLVYSTYPIRSQNRYSTLNLVTLAEEYRAERAAVGSH